ncbi:BTAD domain-containing putative transcriptional regulator [Glycomyces tenuis]|uniref:BTAD domain-containing putative transcriptional regulator n=1 Tax=Glycomyces tenuis TaxID=58116 RepID=UPI0003F69D5B|nr:BTAD domain-containing putative transcriptional regulator [Glycomyces tenuis]
MRFGILGPLEVETDGGERVPVPERKVRALLARLLVDPGRTVAAGRLIDDLWGERPPADARAALQTKVSGLRRVLASADRGGRALIERHADGYRLAVDADAVDAARFEALTARAARAEPAERAELLEAALALWRGPALEEFDALTAPAARLEELRLATAEDLLDVGLDLGRQVLPETAALVERHPRRERLRAVHMRALYRAGRHSEALESFRDLRERLAAELGIEPGREIAELHRAILRHDPALAPPPEPSRGNLPAQLTPLIGRDADIERLRSLLGDARLVTLTGPGGVGKTRLALGAAAAAAGDFPDGTWLVELAGFEAESEPDAELLAAAVAETMGLPGAAPRAGHTPAAPFDLLRSALGGKRTLLIVDNCEHLTAAAAELCARLLAAPGVRVLATSREPLRLPGERVAPVPPLEVPSGEAASVGIADFSAVRLFLARAEAARPGFELTDRNAAAVAAVCERLDGLPLALELAATRVPSMGVEALAEQLADRLLNAEGRGLPARQRTVRAVIDWSWALLGETERTVLGRLAVASGGALLDTAAALCGDLPESEVVEALAALVDRSLLESVGEDRPRYRMLESVSVYCRERLREDGSYEDAAERHGRFFTELAEQSWSALRGPGQYPWLLRLDAESANLHTALDNALRRGDAERALRLSVNLSWYRYLRGSLSEAYRSLAAALALAAPAPEPLRAAARFWHACFAMLTESDAGPEPAEAVKLASELTDPRTRAYAELFAASTTLGIQDDQAEFLTSSSREAFASLGDAWGVAAAEAMQSWFEIVRGEVGTARELAERSQTVLGGLGDGWGELQALETLAVLAEITGDYEEARRLNLEGLDIAETLGLRIEQAYRISRLGRVEMLIGRFDTARELHRQSLKLSAEHSARQGELFAATGLLLLERRAWRLDEAEQVAAEWLEPAMETIGHPGGTAMFLGEFGFIAEMRGDADKALALHRRSLAVVRSTGLDDRAAAFALEGLAGARSLAGDHHRAAEALGAAAELRERSGVPLPAGERFDVDRIRSRIVDAVGEDAFAAGHARGRAMDAADFG